MAIENEIRKLRIYLDASVINFLFANDVPDFRKATEEFFARHAARYDLYISNVVVLEIGRDPDAAHRAQLESAVARYSLVELPAEPRDEIEALAAAYVQGGIVPANKADDALHVAYATVHEMDVLLSWNFRHLANVRREARFLAVNHQLGYRYPLRLVSPLEVEDED
jgi:predicted nucleic acid-binding protein